MGRTSFLLNGFLMLLLSLAGVAVFCDYASAALSTPQPVGKWIAPIIFLGAFALLSQGFMHLDPQRKKANEKTVGVITLVVGLMWWPFLIAMIYAQGLGLITNFVTGLAGMYAFFFTVLGILEIFSLPKKSLGGIAILIGWSTLAYALFWLLNGLKVSWVYHFSIAFVWFVAMNLAGLLMQGRMNEKLVGWVVTFAALYTFAIPAILWSMPAGMQGPF